MQMQMQTEGSQDPPDNTGGVSAISETRSRNTSAFLPTCRLCKLVGEKYSFVTPPDVDAGLLQPRKQCLAVQSEAA
jgi:hypothetical protein